MFLKPRNLSFKTHFYSRRSWMTTTMLANHRTCGIKLTDKFIQTSNENLRQFFTPLHFYLDNLMIDLPSTLKSMKR